MFSIKTRLIVSYSLMFGILLVAYSIFIHHMLRGAGIATLDTRLEVTAGRFEDELEEIYHDKGRIDYDDILLAKKQTPVQFSIRLWDTTGTVVYTDTLLASAPDPRQNGEQDGMRHASVMHRGPDEYRTAVLPIRIHNSPYFIAQVSLPTTEISESSHRLQTLINISFPLAFLLSAIAGYLIVHVGFRPMTKMIKSAQNISEKNLEERLPIPQTNDEVRTLGITFNRMIERIESAFQSQRQFIADASHEIRSPLTIISAELEYAKRTAADSEAKESIQIAIDEVDTLKRITDDLLLLARLDAHRVVLSKRTCRLDEIAAECIRKEKHVAEAKGISIQLKVDPGMEFFGDGEKIGSVVTILLDNAIKYSFERTMVGVELFRLRETALCLRVTNSGPGISHEDALHVFDRFFRASATRTVNSGSGLGLAIARSIIELHAGTIVVESVPNEKTVFTVSLPNIPPARQAAS